MLERNHLACTSIVLFGIAIGGACSTGSASDDPEHARAGRLRVGRRGRGRHRGRGSDHRRGPGEGQRGRPRLHGRRTRHRDRGRRRGELLRGRGDDGGRPPARRPSSTRLSKWSPPSPTTRKTATRSDPVRSGTTSRRCGSAGRQHWSACRRRSTDPIQECIPRPGRLPTTKGKWRAGRHLGNCMRRRSWLGASLGGPLAADMPLWRALRTRLGHVPSRPKAQSPQSGRLPRATAGTAHWSAAHPAAAHPEIGGTASSPQELRPGRNRRHGVGRLGQEARELRMMPAELVSGAVSVRRDPRAQARGLGDQLLGASALRGPRPCCVPPVARRTGVALTRARHTYWATGAAGDRMTLPEITVPSCEVTRSRCCGSPASSRHEKDRHRLREHLAGLCGSRARPSPGPGPPRTALRGRPGGRGARQQVRPHRLVRARGSSDDEIEDRSRACSTPTTAPSASTTPEAC